MIIGKSRVWRMNPTGLLLTGLALGLCAWIHPGYGQGSGPDECAGCHEMEVKSFRLTQHAAQNEGCGMCHGNTAAHAGNSGSIEELVNPGKLDMRRSKEVCLHCHRDQEKDSEERFQTVESRHDELSCHECHPAHLQGRKGESDLSAFKVHLKTDCSGCHMRESDDFVNSKHGSADLDCGDCHEVHETKTFSEKVDQEIEKCLFCHPGQELEFKYPYPHPLRERQITCTGCHNPHSEEFEKMLKGDRDEVCGECHADVRIEGGQHPTSKNTNHPFETVGCTECHRAHGSNFERVLIHPSNTICSTCHQQP